VVNFNSYTHSPKDLKDPNMKAKIICEIDELLLLPGQYRMNVMLSDSGELLDHIEAAAVFEVEPGELQGRPVAVGTSYGNVCMQHKWILPA
jgi:lipopolysaccharide transport system ATP-binding protein